MNNTIFSFIIIVHFSPLLWMRIQGSIWLLKLLISFFRVVSYTLSLFMRKTYSLFDVLKKQVMVSLFLENFLLMFFDYSVLCCYTTFHNGLLFFSPCSFDLRKVNWLASLIVLCAITIFKRSMKPKALFFTSPFFCFHSARRAQSDVPIAHQRRLLLNTRELFCVLIHETERAYIGGEWQAPVVFDFVSDRIDTLTQQEHRPLEIL